MTALAPLFRLAQSLSLCIHQTYLQPHLYRLGLAKRRASSHKTVCTQLDLYRKAAGCQPIPLSPMDVEHPGSALIRHLWHCLRLHSSQICFLFQISPLSLCNCSAFSLHSSHVDASHSKHHFHASPSRTFLPIFSLSPRPPCAGKCCPGSLCRMVLLLLLPCLSPSPLARLLRRLFLSAGAVA